ncbi:hypothetical protein CHLRE_02g143127v5 [Chlamydomonas reinhardtii]|uniref:Uncharacterized protein n=1 Tax=Chlamydomonas reinhardtii TaxID=3055 RepID=A0A2K3E4M3_CHLRE|nr:uncharacterized protein CHLRE_02g143127v5 [Chlamydomonas reinhardtii]PNW87703.1 hypothetical protein CHLRE_02g143127v5 [Chlamydomonas reinhardtii]
MGTANTRCRPGGRTQGTANGGPRAGEPGYYYYYSGAKRMACPMASMSLAATLAAPLSASSLPWSPV